MSQTTIAAALLALALASPALGEAWPGETLISRINSTDSHLIDMNGNIIKTWHGAHFPAHIAYLLDDGSILRPCRCSDIYFQGAAVGGRIQRIDTDDNVTWDYRFATYEYQQHHDIEPLPNGNVLVLAWERKSHAEAIAAGRVNLALEMWPTLIAEIEPVGPTGGNIVWEWRLWDHMVQDVDPEKPNYGAIADHPELLDINYGLVPSGDWIHVNAITYNPELDQIVFSSFKTHEIYIIDHSTTSAEAAGHTGGDCGKGGDFLYRWGNPQVYERGDASDRYYYGVHGVNWNEAGMPGAGRLLTFNNGNRLGDINDYSSVEEIETPLLPDGNYDIAPGDPFGPAAPAWVYSNPGSFYSDHIGGAYRMPNGNTLICEGAERNIFEVDAIGTIVWQFFAHGQVHRAQRYPASGTAVPPGGDATATSDRFSAYPNPSRGGVTLAFTLKRPSNALVEIFDTRGRLLRTLPRRPITTERYELRWDGKDSTGRSLPAGLYLARLRLGEEILHRRLLLLH